VDHAGALADPQQPDGEGENANDQKQLTHWTPHQGGAAIARALCHSDAGAHREQEQGGFQAGLRRFAPDTKKPRAMPGLFR
jgi:hypothetical protein